MPRAVVVRSPCDCVTADSPDQGHACIPARAIWVSFRRSETLLTSATTCVTGNRRLVVTDMAPVTLCPNRSELARGLEPLTTCLGPALLVALVACAKVLGAERVRRLDLFHRLPGLLVTSARKRWAKRWVAGASASHAGLRSDAHLATDQGAAQKALDRTSRTGRSGQVAVEVGSGPPWDRAQAATAGASLVQAPES